MRPLFPGFLGLWGLLERRWLLLTCRRRRARLENLYLVLVLLLFFVLVLVLMHMPRLMRVVVVMVVLLGGITSTLADFGSTSGISR